MTLARGTRLGPYEIAELRGKGGMGEVYRARDPRLDRDVAIKVLPAELSGDPEWRRRLEREAKAISRLQHPNVCALYDAAFEGERHYLVMEYLAGETLADRVVRGALPLADVARIGVEIAEAIAAAHRLGIVHRDLKPGNVMLTKTGAKVLDFGLASGFGGHPSPADVLSHSPTIAQPLTASGTIAGTLQYMSPEQLEGREADARSDLWALGCVLYEMASGERAFAGESAARAIAAVMTSRPRPLRESKLGIPRRLDWLVERCLERDPERRWQSAKDLAIEIETLTVEAEAEGAPNRAGRDTTAWRSNALPLRVSVELPPGVQLVRVDLSFASPIALSPADDVLVFAGVDGGESRLYRRRLESFESEAIAGTGLTLFGADGSSRRLTELDEGASEWEHTWPQFLPDGKHVLFTVWTWKRGGAHVVSLETGERRRVVRHAMGARLIAPDLLVFRDSHRSDLMAARFDLDELRVVGEPVPLPDPVYQTARAGGAGSFCVSAAGTMIYEPAATGQRTHSPGWIAADARSSASAHRAPTRLPRSRRTDDGWHSSGTTSVRYRGGTRPVREATSGSTISSAARATDSLIEPTTSAQPGCPMASTSPSPRTATVCGTRM